MPFIKVNLNGRKYVISGLTERTSSKHILCSLARVDSTFHLETTDLSDTSLEIDESKKGVRSSRSRMRHTRERHSSTSSLEITEWKKCLRGVVSEKSCLIHECVNGTTKRQEWNEENIKSKCSRKLLFKETTNEKEKQILESKTEISKTKQETSCEDQLEERSGEGKEKEKGEVKRRRKMKTKKRPVSQDITSWKEKNESNENGEKTKLGKKGWKSADDVRGKKCSHFLSCEKMDEKMKRNKKPTHNRKPKHLHCHKRDKHQNIVADSIDNKPSEYHRVHRHVREELNKIKIQKLVSRVVDQRLVDFQVACLQSSQRTHTSVKQNQNEETKRKLIQLINSQRKCLTALSKAEKQTKKSINRYKRYLDLDKEKIHFCNAKVDRENFARERERSSDTEHDTGISEQHSDSSTENKQMTSYDVFKYDVKFNYVVSDDVIRSDEALESKESKTADSLLTGEDAKTCESMLKIIDNSKTYDISKSDVIIDGVTSDDVINNQDLETRNIITIDLSCDKSEDAAKMDGTLQDDVINEVELNDFTQSAKDVIIATQTEVVPFDQSEISSTTVPCCSACSITTSTVSEMSDYCCYSNPIDSYPRDIQGCQEVLMKEEARELKLKQTVDRMSGEMRLMDLRMLEHNKMADILESLKNLNNGLEKDDKETERPDEQDLQQEKKNLKQSIKLSKNLYEYQKGEMKDNAVSLQIIESQIKRKRWHVESAVRGLGQFVTRSLRTQLERIQSLEEVTGITTSVVFKPQLNGTLV